MQILRLNKRGVAILMALAATSVMLAASVVLNRKIRNTLDSTATARDRLVLAAMASSGIDVAKALLLKDALDNEYDSLLDAWADPTAVNEALALASFEDGSIKLTITDELSRLQVNSLVKYPEMQKFNEPQRAVLENLLREMLAGQEVDEDTSPPGIVNSLKDWMDSNDGEAISGLSGAETGYYQGLDPPYSCADRPIVLPGELLLVKGITPKFFYGDENTSGFDQFVTPFGALNSQAGAVYDGRININTVSLGVLKAMMPLGMEDLAEEIFEFRTEAIENETADVFSTADWYKKVPGLGQTTIGATLIAIKSAFFRIRCEAELDGIKLTVTAVVQRVAAEDSTSGPAEVTGCRVLYWEEN